MSNFIINYDYYYEAWYIYVPCCQYGSTGRYLTLRQAIELNHILDINKMGQPERLYITLSNTSIIINGIECSESLIF